ncbi:MAG: hypothetical protein ACM359_00405 [Bacillota bacterium]
MSDDTPTISVTITAAVPLRLLICRTCDTPFAVAVPLWARMIQARQPLLCPAGHANATGEESGAGPEAAATLHQLAQELSEAQHQLQAAEAELTNLRPKLGTAGLPDNQETRRRCHLLAERAERGQQNHWLCRLCGKAKQSSRDLGNHLYRQHREAVRQLPAAMFE